MSSIGGVMTAQSNSVVCAWLNCFFAGGHGGSEDAAIVADQFGRLSSPALISHPPAAGGAQIANRRSGS